jgi:hypothetical protein
MRFIRQSVFLLLIATGVIAHAQRWPFLAAGPHPPLECLFPFQDSRGGLWVASCEDGPSEILYFDGVRYISPLPKGTLKGFVRGMAEDSEGGIVIASSAGIYRLYKGALTRIVEGAAVAGIVKIAPDVFLATLSSPGDDIRTKASAFRITRDHEQWHSDAIIPWMPQVQFRLDRQGSVLYGCDGGFCEFRSEAALHWRPGSSLEITRHDISTGSRYAQGSVVWRDSLGCVWLRNTNEAAYKCPEDAHAVTLSPGVVSAGYPLILELDDGSIVISGFSELAIGRPGRFQVLTKENGYPGSAGTIVLRDGSLWLNSGFVLTLKTRMEFWSEREGLERNAVSIARVGDKIFSIVDHSVMVLDSARRRWQALIDFPGGVRLLAGPEGTVMAASHEDGVIQMDTMGKVIRRSPRMDIIALAKSPDGQYWALGSSVFKIVFIGNHLRLDSVSSPDPPGREGDLKFDLKGRLWTCGAEGLALREAERWRVISTSMGLLENTCAALVPDRTGSIWYGYGDARAFSRIQNPETDTPSIRHFEGGGEVGMAGVYFLDVDDRGWLWRGATDGIHVADPEQAKNGQWLRLDREDGLPETNANIGAFASDSDGSVWFGITNSIVHVYPSPDFIHPRFTPSAFVSSFSANDGDPQIADDRMSIAHGSEVTAHIGSLQFDRRNALRIRYRLLPEQASWTNGRDLDLHLGKLRWGKHTLQVQGQLSTGP